MTQPTQQEIDQALDALDWMDLPTIMKLRAMVSETIRRAAKGGEDRSVATATPPQIVEWTRPTIALFYVIWMSSDEVLENAMKRKAWDASVH